MSKQDMLHIDKRLPMIRLPKDKVKVFIEWFNEDLRKVKDIPEVFDEGYLEIDYSDILHIQTASIFECRSEREIKAQSDLKKATDNAYKKMILHFKVDGSGGINYTAYSGVGERLADQTISPKQDKLIEAIINMARADSKNIGPENLSYAIPSALPKLELDLRVNNKDEWQERQSKFNRELGATCSGLLTAVIWYLATNKVEKYLIDSNTQIIESTSHNKIKKHNYHRSINTPVYELIDKRPVTVERLIKKRAGWTISHSFQVRGHYRHYKNGKTIFVKSYVKGKDKDDFHNIDITLKPSEV